MNIEEIYDRYVADRYDRDPFELIGSSRLLAGRQIRRRMHHDDQLVPSVIDLGMGTGEMLLQCRDLFPQGRLHGRDISGKMVEAARRKVRGAHLAQGDAIDVPEDLEPASMDLAITHFLMNYVEHHRLALAIDRMLRPRGLWSIATTTGESFPGLQRLALGLIDEKTLRAQYSVPAHPDHLEQMLADFGFQVRERMVLEQLIEFADLDALLDFALHTGWFACALLVQSMPRLPELRPLLAPLFPIRDVARITICLAQKQQGRPSAWTS